MRAVTWQGRRKVSVDTVPDPAIKEPTDAIIRVTSTNICGSDLHLYEVLGAFMTQGDILGHEAMGVVEEVGREVDDLSVGDRVVIPFNICCGQCFMCDHGLQSQCETTQNRDQGTGAALFGYSKLYGEVAGGQAEYLRVPQAQYTHIKVPQDGPDERTCTCPTCCPPPGRPSSTPKSPGAARWWCSASGRSGRWRAGSHTAAIAASSASTWSTNDSVAHGSTAKTSSTSARTTSKTWSAATPMAAAPIRSSTRSAWRRTARRSPRRHRPQADSCRRPSAASS